MFPISLTILLLFLIQIFSQSFCMIIRSIDNTEEARDVRNLLNRFRQNVESRNLEGATKLFSIGARIHDNDGTERSPRDFAQGLMNQGNWNIDMNNVACFGTDHPNERGISFPSSNNEYNMETGLLSLRLHDGRQKYIGGEHLMYARETTTVEPARGAPSSSDNQDNSYHYDQEPSTSRGSGKSKSSKKRSHG